MRYAGSCISNLFSCLRCIDHPLAVRIGSRNCCLFLYHRGQLLCAVWHCMHDTVDGWKMFFTKQISYCVACLHAPCVLCIQSQYPICHSHCDTLSVFEWFTVIYADSPPPRICPYHCCMCDNIGTCSTSSSTYFNAYFTWFVVNEHGPCLSAVIAIPPKYQIIDFGRVGLKVPSKTTKYTRAASSSRMESAIGYLFIK